MANTASPAGRRYIRRFMLAMSLYIVLVLGTAYAFRLFDLTGPVAWALAVAPALPIVAMIAIMGLYLKEEVDEFQRNVLVEAILWGFGLTMALTTVWGFLEFHAGAPGLPSFWVFPIFCGAMGVAQVLVGRRYR